MYTLIESSMTNVGYGLNIGDAWPDGIFTRYGERRYIGPAAMPRGMTQIVAPAADSVYGGDGSQIPEPDLGGGTFKRTKITPALVATNAVLDPHKDLRSDEPPLTPNQRVYGRRAFGKSPQYTIPRESADFVFTGDAREQDILVKSKIGYLPENNPLYKDMYIKEYLSFVGNMYKINNLKKRVSEIIQQTGLTPEQNKKISQLSKGYRQRVGLAAALIHNPEVLILDEPTTGLDPNQLVEIRNLIKEVGKDKTVLLSTHIMQEVDKMCNRVIIINKGKIVDDQLISNYQKNNIDLEEHFRKLTA